MIGLSVIIIALSFFAGTKYQASKTPTFDRSRLAGMVGRGQSIQLNPADFRSGHSQ